MSGSGIDVYDVMSLDVFFPAGHVCCDLCPILETYARKQCRMTGEYLIDTRCVGLRCPLIENNEKKEQMYSKKEKST